MTELFELAKLAAAIHRLQREVACTELSKSLNLVRPGMLKEGMAEPEVFARFPDVEEVLYEGTLVDTVGLMIDLSPFSKFVASSTAVQIRDLLDCYYDVSVPIIESHGGVVEKYIGDAIIALFGAPFGTATTDSSHVHEAFQAALNVTTKADSTFGSQLKAKSAIVRGQMFLGFVGPPSHAELTAVGNPLTLLHRLESVARPNEILLTESLYGEIKGEFDGCDSSVPGSWVADTDEINLRGVGLTPVTRCRINV